ncbi:MAG: acyl carrier protein [Clostridiales bacterium]|jgi:acyl carrier protein|nr:acyl carrier protein [Clostridiales bacterium]
MDELLKILTNMYPDVDFKTHKALIYQGVLDSFDIVSLIAEIDDVFGIRIPPLEIMPENFNSADALYTLITRLSESEV